MFHRSSPFRIFRLFRFSLALTVGLSTLGLSVTSATFAAEKTLEDYRYFRALAIDLLGRMPTREEIASFESPVFDVDRWIEARLTDASYGERVLRVYQDVLRLEVGPAFALRPPAATLHRVTVLGPDGKNQSIWYRPGQRRTREATDGDFCFTLDESGIQVANNLQIKGSPKALTKALLEANTVLVRPWWLYRDYATSSPTERVPENIGGDLTYKLADDLRLDVGGVEAVDVRVCKEEANRGPSGTIYASGRSRPKGPPPYARVRPLPADDAYAVAHKGEPIACRSVAALNLSADCGCGVGLDQCMPGDDRGRAFFLPTRAPLGLDEPFNFGAHSASDWTKLWWSQEADRFLLRVFNDDRDIREILTAKWSLVNGPLAQFYRGSQAPASTRALAFGALEEGEPLFLPKNVPSDLRPHDLSTFKLVDDRGPNAAGILTMPVFLTKYASRRARAATLYTAFQCKSFNAGSVALTPSTENDLTKRPGCSTCHSTLEPMSAAFTRVLENDFRYLPESIFPLSNPRCKLDGKGNSPGFCRPFYDPIFSDAKAGLLRGSYASHVAADAGPVALAKTVSESPEYAACAVERMTGSFLGRNLTPDDAPTLKELTDIFAKNGYRMRALVRALVKSAAYRAANQESTGGGGT